MAGNQAMCGRHHGGYATFWDPGTTFERTASSPRRASQSGRCIAGVSSKPMLAGWPHQANCIACMDAKHGICLCCSPFMCGCVFGYVQIIIQPDGAPFLPRALVECGQMSAMLRDAAILTCLDAVCPVTTDAWPVPVSHSSQRMWRASL
eukprot:357806-Chlamydomonas_euryale.AAC.8